jgi:hypothetical protein
MAEWTNPGLWDKTPLEGRGGKLLVYVLPHPGLLPKEKVSLVARFWFGDW